MTAVVRDDCGPAPAQHAHARGRGGFGPGALKSQDRIDGAEPQAILAVFARHRRTLHERQQEQESQCREHSIHAVADGWAVCCLLLCSGGGVLGIVIPRASSPSS